MFFQSLFQSFDEQVIYGLSDEQLEYMADAILESVEEMQKGI